MVLVVFMKVGNEGWRVSLVSHKASNWFYSQNQSQGIKLGAHKEKVGASGWLCGKTMMERGGLVGGVVWRGSHERQGNGMSDQLLWAKGEIEERDIDFKDKGQLFGFVLYTFEGGCI